MWDSLRWSFKNGKMFTKKIVSDAMEVERVKRIAPNTTYTRYKNIENVML